MPLSQDKPPPMSLSCPPGFRLVGQDCYPELAGGAPATPTGAGTLGQEAAAYAVGGKIEPHPPAFPVLLIDEEEEITTSSPPAAATKPFPWHLVLIAAIGAAVIARMR